MITRKEYLANEATHNEYYAQFVTQGIRDTVQRFIGLDRIKNSNDPHMNDIPLKEWDSLTRIFGSQTNAKLKECEDYLTLATSVCILKEAARQLKDA